MLLHNTYFANEDLHPKFVKLLMLNKALFSS